MNAAKSMRSSVWAISCDMTRARRGLGRGMDCSASTQDRLVVTSVLPGRSSVQSHSLPRKAGREGASKEPETFISVPHPFRAGLGPVYSVGATNVHTF